MIRTQIQFPDKLYRELKALAEAQEWTMAETVRRSVEEYLDRHPVTEKVTTEWKLPVVDLGPLLVPDADLRLYANEVDDLSRIYPNQKGSDD